MYVVDEEDSTVFRYPEDVEAAPEQLPVGFVNYLTGLLEQNQTAADDDASCVTGYTVSKFTASIVRGAQGEVASSDATSDEECSGGGFTVWTTNESGVWSELYGGHDRPDCSVLEDNDIPPEIEETCLDENGEGPFFNPLAPENYEIVNL